MQWRPSRTAIFSRALRGVAHRAPRVRVLSVARVRPPLLCGRVVIMMQLEDSVSVELEDLE